jgi:hypothetical protein
MMEELHDKLIDLELAKSDNKNSTVRRFLPAAVLAATFYYSFLMTAGLALGYFGARLFHKYFVESGKVDCIFIDCGKWKVHWHHWMTAALFLAIVWVLDYFYLPRFFFGVVLGIIAHDVYDFNDWHKVIIKNEEDK